MEKLTATTKKSDKSEINRKIQQIFANFDQRVRFAVSTLKMCTHLNIKNNSS